MTGLPALLLSAFLSQAQPDEPAPTTVPAPSEEPTPKPTQADLLEAAGEAVMAGNSVEAIVRFQRVVSADSTSVEAEHARWALKVLAQFTSPPGSRARITPANDDDRGIIYRREPFSRHTNERLRLTTWEKLDFGVTSFLYGLSNGLTLSLASSKSGNPSGAMAIGAIVYTVAGVAFLSSADPDRADLPLALGIASYVPMATLLALNTVSEDVAADTSAQVTAIAGLVALPAAAIAARHLDLDPGDTQLVRDAGFWGLVLGVSGTLAWGGKDGTYGYEGPSSHKISGFGLLGLTGGLGLGALVAANTEISLERVRVTTWGGYGGAVLGILFAAGESEHEVYQGLTIGAALGLGVTFLTSAGIDGIPPETPLLGSRSRLHLAPMWTPSAVAGEPATLALGVSIPTP